MQRSSSVPLPVQLDQMLEPFSQLITDLALLIPRLIGALVILLIGWFFGRIVARIVSTIVDRVELDRLTLRTPLGDVLGGTERAVSNTFGTLAAYYIYFIAVLAAANVLDIPLLSAWIADAASYLPAFIGGLVIIVIGFIVVDFVGDVIERSSATTDDRYTSLLATAVQMFLYFIVIVVALDTMQVDVGILYIFAAALAGGLGLALAIGLGIAFGFGARGYVADNIDEWAGQAGAGMGPGSRREPRGSDADSDIDMDD
ncbi:hypothetical protein [Halalkalicoccus sp. NIPERK01]|uniref:mechanosensitive ion channel family protein n=1 Tax=Halalkalicoccus sp. NIPERK01 TaxID=3053469 RepID=UPI00256EF5AE|nr:hypothetical protein [Halalkalicoccus sp. NIPERK01]MDL5360826.1 hypothetical protein [Halalkalicoccus sp. NIPERK01]